MKGFANLPVKVCRLKRLPPRAELASGRSKLSGTVSWLKRERKISFKFLLIFKAKMSIKRMTGGDRQNAPQAANDRYNKSNGLRQADRPSGTRSNRQ